MKNKPFNIYEFLKKRPLSWSAISSFEYDPEQWYKRYILGEKTPENAEMKFGKFIGEKIATDPTFMPFVPRLGKHEHELRVMFGKIALIGFMDDFCAVSRKKMYELKTGVKEWDQKRVDEHGQITLYNLLHYITEKVKPEDMENTLIWLPTKRTENGNFEVKIEFVEPIEKTMKIFKTKRTMADILQFGARINRIVGEMNKYVLDKTKNCEVDKIILKDNIIK